jgi:hypothetical protein
MIEKISTSSYDCLNWKELSEKLNEIIDSINKYSGICEHQFQQQVNCTANCKICTKCGVIQY